MNKERNTKQTSSAPTQNFFSEQKVIEDSIKNYEKIPRKYYINESYFLYDESDLIKDTFIMALNKISLFNLVGLISYFNKKAENEIFKIVSPEEFLKFYVDKDATKNSLSFQLTNISGDIPKLRDSKIYSFA